MYKAEGSKQKKIIRGKLEIDLIVQLVLIVIWAIELLSGWGDRAAFVFYLTLGGYQLLSSLIHLVLQKPDVYFRAYYIQLIVYIPFFLSLFQNMIGAGIFLLFLIIIRAYQHAKQGK